MEIKFEQAFGEPKPFSCEKVRVHLKNGTTRDYYLGEELAANLPSTKKYDVHFSNGKVLQLDGSKWIPTAD